MNIIHTTNYKIYKLQVKEDYKIAIISDLHFSSKISEKKLQKIKNFLSLKTPDYIFLVGDLINNVNVIRENQNRKQLLMWLEELGKICKTFISIGNHDFYMNNNGHHNYYYDEKLFNDINNLNNINVLNNKSFSDERVNIVGITQSFDYFHSKNTKEEDKNILLNDLEKIRYLLENLPKEKINFALIHSPVWLEDNEIKNKLKEFDYIISGHMHNGCVPPILYELWHSTRGFIAPKKNIFPKNERNTLINKNDKLLVNGPLTTFQGSRGINKFNILFPMYMSFIEFTNNKSYDTKKIYTKRRYETKKHLYFL